VRFVIVRNKSHCCFLVCRPSSALGLEQPDDAAEAPAPELERVFDAAVPDIRRISLSALKSAGLK
jgi:hypothetical protein